MFSGRAESDGSEIGRSKFEHRSVESQAGGSVAQPPPSDFYCGCLKTPFGGIFIIGL